MQEEKNSKKGNQGINVEKKYNRFKKIKIIQKRERKKGKLPRTAKAQCRGRGYYCYKTTIKNVTKKRKEKHN